jgi:hypothetical protein
LAGDHVLVANDRGSRRELALSSIARARHAFNGNWRSWTERRTQRARTFWHGRSPRDIARP